ncbi:TKL protein kinase [Phytophthora cinnamomi]|uniref:TKL protein kinase n=1 Tax=Phytophthora cinnamomi TaxID=4785 RepID=UPI0035596465|nr:TKL protein kinase [Phytophthora cinnamomi]
MRLLSVPVLAGLHSQVAGSSLYKVWIYYAGNSCDGTPYNTYAESDRSCTIASCFEDGNTSTTGVGLASVDCTSDYKTSTRNAFGSSPYIYVEVYSDPLCQTLSYAQGFFASGNCEGSPNVNTSEVGHVIASLQPDGSAQLRYYHDTTCDRSNLYATYSANVNVLGSHQCDKDWSKWYYINGDDSFNPSTSSSPGADEETTTKHSDDIKMILLLQPPIERETS